MQPLVAKWTPKSERNSLFAFIFSGSQVGTILATLLSGLLAGSVGWRAVFYLQGSLAVPVVFIWLYWAYDSPSVHPRIGAEERDFVQSTTVVDNAAGPARVPWRALVTSRPCWALLAATLGSNWAFYVLLVELPVYIKTILGFDLKSVISFKSICF